MTNLYDTPVFPLLHPYLSFCTSTAVAVINVHEHFLSKCSLCSKYLDQKYLDHRDLMVQQ